MPICVSLKPDTGLLPSGVLCLESGCKKGKLELSGPSLADYFQEDPSLKGCCVQGPGNSKISERVKESLVPGLLVNHLLKEHLLSTI